MTKKENTKEKTTDKANEGERHDRERKLCRNAMKKKKNQGNELVFYNHVNSIKG